MLRILTVFSIIFLPATLIASIWGMNVGLPGGGDPGRTGHIVFWIIIAAMVGGIVGMVGFFRTSAGSQTGTKAAPSSRVGTPLRGKRARAEPAHF